MSDSPEPFVVYGESFPIAGGLAMDAALPPRKRNNSMPVSPTPSSRRRIALDMDTMLVDEQWQKLQDFLSDKLSPEDMETVETICRGGGDVPPASEDRRRSSGASDAALDGEERTLQYRHRAGHITEGQLVTGMRDIRRRRGTIAQDSRSVVSPLDKLEAEFPHMNRLKR